jgi:hypothetical protein
MSSHIPSDKEIPLSFLFRASPYTKLCRAHTVDVNSSVWLVVLEAREEQSDEA